MEEALLVGLPQHLPTISSLIITFFLSTGKFKASVLMSGSIQSPAFTVDEIFILVNHLSITLSFISLVVKNWVMCMTGESQGTNILFIYTTL